MVLGQGPSLNQKLIILADRLARSWDLPSTPDDTGITGVHSHACLLTQVLGMQTHGPHVYRANACIY